MSLEAVRSEIITILGTITAVKTVYYDMPTQVLITPCVAILSSNGTETPDSTCTNSMEMNYILRCMVEQKDDSDNDRAQTTKLIQLVDDVLDELRKKTNVTLNGDSYNLTFTWGELLVGATGSLTVFYLDVIVTASTLKDTV